LAFIEKRLLNKIALSDMHKLLGYYIRYYDLQFIESDSYGRYTKTQTKIYHDFMNFQIKKKWQIISPQIQPTPSVIIMAQRS